MIEYEDVFLRKGIICPASKKYAILVDFLLAKRIKNLFQGFEPGWQRFPPPFSHLS